MPANTAKKLTQNVTIADLRSQGLSCREISTHLDLSYRQIARRLQDSDVKEILENTVRFYALYAEEIGDSLIGLCGSEKEEIRLKAIDQYYKVLGINTSHAPIFIQNIYQDQRSIYYSPHIQNIIDKECDNYLEGEVIEDE